MARSHIFMISVPGEEKYVHAWFDKANREGFDNECGVQLQAQPRLVALLGPYDFVLEIDCNLMDEVGMVVGWIRSQLKRWILRTVTVLERGDLRRARGAAGW
jgi:hypothetical protein